MTAYITHNILFNYYSTYSDKQQQNHQSFGLRRQDNDFCLHQLLSNPTILNFILLMGGGIGIFNMLGTQLGQLMCPTGPEQALQKR